jgi:DNA-binding NarL/FixJ family response regulator
LEAAVRTVLRGDQLLAPTITQKLIEEFVRRPPRGAGVPERLRDLTERELGVLRLVARGLERGGRQGALPERGDDQDARGPAT